MWLQLVVQMIKTNRPLEAQRSIHMTPKNVEFVGQKSSHIEIPEISSQKSASAHILTNHTVGGWEQKWRHILKF